MKTFSDVAPYSWFIGTALGAGLYALLCRSERAATAAAAVPAVSAGSAEV